MTVYQGAHTAAGQRSALRQVLGTVGAGAATALVVVAFSPFSAATAAFSPPLYALIAGAYSIVPFGARRLLGYPWAATGVGIVAAVLAAPFSPIGILIVVVFAGAGAAYDSVLWSVTRSRAERTASGWICAVAALVSALVLFLVSYPVLSPAHRVPLILAATFGARAVGQLAAVAAGGAVGRLVARGLRFRRGASGRTRGHEGRSRAAGGHGE